MSIRKATLADHKAIKHLLEQLEYPATPDLIKNRMEAMLHHPDQQILVYEDQGKIVGFISLHFIPQIALAGDFAVISYFAVDETARSLGIGKALEEYAVKIATDRKCDRIHVHCHSRRTDAHRFYERQGYEESPKYFIKSLL